MLAQNASNDTMMEICLQALAFECDDAVCCVCPHSFSAMCGWLRFQQSTKLSDGTCYVVLIITRKMGKKSEMVRL